MAALMLLTACSSVDTDSYDWEASDKITLAFKLSVYQGGTRSDETDNTTVTEGPTWGDEYNNENLYYDAAIDPSTVQVCLTDESGKTILADVTPLSCAKDESADNTYTYFGYADKTAFNKLSNGTTLHCMVTANAADKTFAIGDLPDGNTTDDTFYIPMWGVGSFTLNRTTREQNIAEISLLRAAVKCRVKLSEEMSKTYSLSNVTLHPAMSTGYVYPYGYSEVDDTEDLYFVKDKNKTGLYGFNPYSGTPSTTLSKSFLEDPSGNDDASTAWVAYFPEYSNNETNPIYISLSLNKGTTTSTSHTIAFKDYDNDKLYTDLMRNHLYDFTITGIGRSLDLTLQVDDWSVHNMVWDFTEQITTGSLSWTQNTYSSVNTTDKTVTVLSGVAATGTFLIESPVGVTWYATLTSEDYRPFVFVDEQGNEISTVTSGEIDGTSYSTLRVKATNSKNTLQHTATLTIYIEYKDGTTRRVDALSGWQIIQTL
jgi:hypothetical protein